MKKLWLYTLTTLLLLGGILAPPASAQFVGYTSPQTVNLKVFSGQTTAIATPSTSTLLCTPTNGNPCGIPNLGQSIHSVTYSISNACVGNLSLVIRLEASQDGTTFFAISEDAVDQTSVALQGFQNQSGLTAIGYYPVIRLNLVKFSCSAGNPSITAAYSGTSTSAPTPAGIFGEALSFRKVIVQNVDTISASTSVIVTLPSGNTSGVVYVQCFVPGTGAAAACPASGGLQFFAAPADASIPQQSLGSFGVNAVSTLQIFTVPAFLSNRLAIQVNPTGGGGGTNWSVYYQAQPSPGSTATGVNAPQVQTNGADPCQSTAIVKQSAFANITTATTTALVTPSGSTVVYVCGFSLDMVATVAADTLYFEQGTGAACASGPTAISPTYSSGILTNGAVVIPYGNGGATIFKTATSNGLCAVSTVGTGPSIGVLVSYVQQ
jgi:hypothetical protein